MHKQKLRYELEYVKMVKDQHDLDPAMGTRHQSGVTNGVRSGPLQKPAGRRFAINRLK